jgi:hypothetical protein
MVDPTQIVADAEYVRSRLAPQPEQGQVKSPDEMVEDLEWAKYGTGRIALVLKDAGVEVKRCRRALAAASARARQTSTAKASDQRDADVVLAVVAEQEAFDVAESALEFAKSVARGVEQSGSLTQTQAALVRAQMNLAGTGREA